MANKYSRAVSFSTDIMTAEAYNEYCDQIIYQFSSAISCISLVDEEVTGDDAISRILSDPDVKFNGDTQIIIAQHVVRLSGFCNAYHDALVDACHKIDTNQITTSNLKLEVIDSSGETFECYATDVFSDLNAQLHAAVVEQAVAQAYLNGKNVAERLSILRDAVASKFVSAYTDVSNCLNYAVELVKKASDFTSYINSKLISSGVTEGMEDGDIYSSTDVQYTGTSSLFASIFYVGRTILTSGWQFIKDACVANFNMMLRTSKWMGKMIVKGLRWVSQHVDNTPDVGDLDSENPNHTFDGIYHKLTYELEYSYGDHDIIINQLEKHPFHCDFTTCECIIQKNPEASPYINPIITIGDGIRLIKDMVYKQEGITVPAYNDEGYVTYLQSIHEILAGSATTESRLLYLIMLIGQDLLYSIFSRETILEQIQELYDEIYQYWFRYPVDVLIKYKPINPEFVPDSILKSTDPVYTYDVEVITNLLTDLKMDPSAYVFKDPLESDYEGDLAIYKETVMFRGLYLSIVLSYFGFVIMNREASGQSFENWDIIYNRNILVDCSNITSSLTHPITNLSWFTLLTEGKLYINNIEVTLTLPMYSIINVIENVIKYQTEHPLDFEFWPYSTREINWFDGSYYLKTDAQLQSALNDFLLIAVILVVTVYLGVKTFKAIKLAIWTSRVAVEGASWAAAEAAAQGNLSQNLINNYRKAQFKFNILNALTGNLLTATTSAVGSKVLDLNKNYDQVSVDLSPVINLIRGN